MTAHTSLLTLGTSNDWTPVSQSKYKLPGALNEDIVISRVLFRNPATIVFWNDGTKTITKCAKDDKYSKEAGLAICCLKKAFGKKANECLKAFIDVNKNEVNMNDIRKLLKNK